MIAGLLGNATRGLKTVALFEASKGLLVLLVGLAFFSLLNPSIQHVAEEFVSHFHLYPAHHIPQIFVKTFQHITDGSLRFLALLAFLYSVMRFIEAYGLWHEKKWAEWFALISGAVYLPFELYEIIKGITVIKLLLLLINLCIVLYIAVVMMGNIKKKT